jgi:hypothetical protein
MERDGTKKGMKRLWKDQEGQGKKVSLQTFRNFLANANLTNFLVV